MHLCIFARFRRGKTGLSAGPGWDGVRSVRTGWAGLAGSTLCPPPPKGSRRTACWEGKTNQTPDNTDCTQAVLLICGERLNPAGLWSSWGGRGMIGQGKKRVSREKKCLLKAGVWLWWMAWAAGATCTCVGSQVLFLQTWGASVSHPALSGVLTC